MRPTHCLLAVLVAAAWGVNFVVIDAGLDHFPPLLFSALRFLVAALPAVFFVRRPKVAFGWVIAVGLVLGVAKFGLLFLGMQQGMPAGLSSLVLQVQAVFTAALAMLLLNERPGWVRLTGMTIALGGIGVAAYDQGSSGPIGAFVLLILAAASWGLSNILTRKAAPPDALSWMVWVSLIPPLPLLALSLVFEGPQAGADAIRGLNLAGLGTLVYVAWLATVFGFGVWGFLLRQYDASTVAPFSLLVPFFGMSSAALVLGERVSPLGWLAGTLLIGGVAITSMGGIRTGRREVPHGSADEARPTTGSQEATGIPAHVPPDARAPALSDVPAHVEAALGVPETSEVTATPRAAAPSPLVAEGKTKE